jgi:GNAT superfamily N-acetyltransferase
MRSLVLADLPAAMSLLERVGLSSGATNIARYLRWQPDGCWCDDALTGMVTVLRHGTVGFVGCMAVEPAAQGTGIGRALLEHAQRAAREAGVSTFLLEATPAGERLYAKLGYVVEHATWIVGREATGAGAGSIELRTASGAAARPASAGLSMLADHDAIAGLDALATGTTRPMIASLVAACPGVVVREHDELVAYGLVIGERLGPVIARSPAAGRAVVEQLAAPCRVATVPEPNEPARRAFADAGFTDVRRLARMRLGPPVASRVDWVWALASAGAG